MNWVEYVRRDTEGSDNDTRRRAATDLVKALTARFEAQVGPEFCDGVGSNMGGVVGGNLRRPPCIMHVKLTGSYGGQQQRCTAWTRKGRFLVTIRVLPSSVQAVAMMSSLSASKPCM